MTLGGFSAAYHAEIAGGGGGGHNSKKNFLRYTSDFSFQIAQVSFVKDAVE